MIVFEKFEMEDLAMKETPKSPTPTLLSKITKKLSHLDKIDKVLLQLINLLKYIFIITMMLYLFICIMSLSHKIISLTITQGALDFQSIKVILTDGLFTLIVIAIVKTLFIKNGYDYALTFLEIGFVVVIRKLILLDTIPEEAMMTMTLGITSAIFFALIVYVHTVKNKES
ncbi:MAG: hypothetical protein WBG69_00915 [Arcobacteraceae bacterium]